MTERELTSYELEKMARAAIARNQAKKRKRALSNLEAEHGRTARAIAETVIECLKPGFGESYLRRIGEVKSQWAKERGRKQEPV